LKDLSIQKLSGDIYMQQHQRHNQGNTFELSTIKTDTKLVKMDKDRKKAVIAKLQN